MELWIGIAIGFIVGLYAGDKSFRNKVNKWLNIKSKRKTKNKKGQ